MKSFSQKEEPIKEFLENQSYRINEFLYITLQNK
jgi:hypothetical protein